MKASIIKVNSVDFMNDATNLYRTKDFIVRQKISITESTVKMPIVISVDTYFKRTKERDEQYEFLLISRKDLINGKRVKASAYTRFYKD